MPTDGRALGGLSDAIRLRGEPDHPCDEMLEVAVVAFDHRIQVADTSISTRRSRTAARMIGC